MSVKVFKCLRCDWEWAARRNTDKPRICPHCKSPYWDKERRTTQMTHATHSVTPEMKVAQMQKKIDSLEKQLAEAKKKLKK